MNISNSVQKGFDSFFAFLPSLLGFVVLLVVGYIVAKIVQVVVTKALQKVGVDRMLHEGHGGQYVDRVMPGASPSRGIGMVLFWLVFAFFAFAAIAALHVAALTGFMNSALTYLPNIVAAIVIFVVAAAVAGLAGAGAARLMGDTPTGKIVGTVVPALVMVIASFMILDQLRIAHSIVTIAFGATMFALALGLALAFGLGGRDVAQRMLEDAYQRGRDAKEQAKWDTHLAKERAKSEAAARGLTDDRSPTTPTTPTSSTSSWSGTRPSAMREDPSSGYRRE